MVFNMLSNFKEEQLLAYNLLYGDIENNCVTHAYLIDENNYVNSYDMVLSFVKAILCEDRYYDGNNLDIGKCSKCSLCKRIDDGNYPELKIISPDGMYIKKQQIVDLQQEFSRSAVEGKKRIHIIRDCDKMRTEAANSMLKFLEEPEDDVVAILIADNRYHVIDTIISRCQIISLKENFVCSDYSDEFIDLFECILKPKDFYIKYNNFIKNIIPEKSILIEYLNTISDIFISYLNYKHGVIDSFSEDLKIILDKYDDNYLINIISVIEDEIQKLNFNVNYKLWLDAFFAKLIIGG
jgi:hypothetical protein